VAHIYDNTDLTFSWNGDLALGQDGDLGDTSWDYLESLRQDIHMVTASSLQDWEVYPGLGATLADFVGEPNIKATANAIHDRLKMAITTLGVVAEEDLLIKVIPVHINKVLILIKVNAIPTPWNALANGEVLSTQLIFDFMEHGIMFYEKTPDL
jgi:hypothetical protein